MVAGLAAGVAAMVGFRVVIQSVNAAFETRIVTTTGESELQVSAPGAELAINTAVVDSVRAVDGVSAAVPIIDATVIRATSGEPLRIFGLDLTIPRLDAIYGIDIESDQDPLELLNDPEAVLAPRGIALAVDDRIAVDAPVGEAQLRVAGVLSATGALGGAGQPVAVMDVFAAQQLLGLREDVVSYIDIVPAQGVDREELRLAVSRAIGPNYEVGEPLGRAGYRRQALSAFQTIVDGYVLMALVVAGFIAYSAVATAMVLRERTVGQLRTSGVRRQEIWLMVMGEAAVLGAVATTIGIGAGVLLAEVLADALLRTMEMVHLNRLETAELTPSSMDIALAYAGGIATAVVAALVPARRASLLDPIVAASNVQEQQRPGGLRIGAANVLALVFSLVLIVTLWLESAFRSQVLGNAAAVICFGAIACLCPLVLTSVIRRVLPTLHGRLGIPGEIAAMFLQTSTTKTAWVVGLIGLVLTAIITLGGIFRSFETSAEGWVADYLAGDFTVASTHTRGGWLEEPLAPELGKRLLSVEGVAGVDTWRLVPGQDMDGVRIGIQAVSDSFLTAENYGRWIVDGRVDHALDDVRAGEGVIISESITRHTPLEVGDFIELKTPSGLFRRPVSGVFVDYTNDRGVVVLSADTFGEWWQDDRVTRFLVRTERGADLAFVERGIEAELGSQSRYKVLSVSQLLDYHRTKLYDAFGAVDVLYTVLLVPTAVGILLYLFTSYHDRRSEMARLVGQGVLRSQLVAATSIELVVVLAAGLALGLVGGAISGSLWVHYHLAYLLGWVLSYGFPWAICGRGAAMIAAVCLASLLLPAWQLRRLEVASVVAEDA